MSKTTNEHSVMHDNRPFRNDFFYGGVLNTFYSTEYDIFYI